MTTPNLTIEQVNKGIEALIRQLGRDEAHRALVIAGVGPAVAEKLCGRRYTHLLGEDNANAFLRAMVENGIPLKRKVAS